MLPKINRLQKRKDLEKVFKKGKDFKKDSLVFKVLENNLNRARFGFIVSSKISRKVVIRNKIKRRLREIVRKRLEEAKRGIDGVFIALPDLEKKEFQEMQNTIDELFKKAGIT